MTPATLYFKPMLCTVSFRKLTVCLNYLYSPLIGYLTSYISCKYMSYEGICSHFLMTSLKKLYPSFWFICRWKRPQGFDETSSIFSWHKSTAITVTLFRLLLFWMCQFCPRDLLEAQGTFLLLLYTTLQNPGSLWCPREREIHKEAGE